MPPITSLGNTTKTVFLSTENHKQTIEATAAVAIKKGQPVKLDANGKVSLWTKANLRHTLIGYAYHDCAADELVTIWTRGYAVVYGISTAALSAGPVAYQGYDNATSLGGAVGYSQYANSATAEENNAWALDSAAGANGLVRILLMD